MPSADLRAAVATRDFVFGAVDLLKFIDDYAPTYAQKLGLFSEAARELGDKRAARHALKLIEHNKRKYDAFMTASDDAVYEVDIKCEPLDSEETYIVKTFDDALAVIRMFLKRYKRVGARDGKLARYTVTKKTAVAPKRPGDINKLGAVGECVLGMGLEILSVDAYDMGNEYRCVADCDDCKHKCLNAHFPAYPAFIEPFSLVAFHSGAYRKTENGGYTDVEYGVLACDMAESPDYSYVVMTDGKYDKKPNVNDCTVDDCYRMLDAHCHPPYAELFVPDVSAVPKDVYSDCAYISTALRRHGLLVSSSRA